MRDAAFLILAPCCLQADAHYEKVVLGDALQTWRLEAHAQAVDTDKLMVAAIQWRQMSLASAFRAWVQWHQGHRQQQQTLDLVLRRWAHGHASHAFATWQHWAQEQRALRDVVGSPAYSQSCTSCCTCTSDPQTSATPFPSQICFLQVAREGPWHP